LIFIDFAKAAYLQGMNSFFNDDFEAANLQGMKPFSNEDFIDLSFKFTIVLTKSISL